MDRQLSLIPVSQAELNESAFRINKILEEIEEADETLDAQKTAHKEFVGGRKQELKDIRATIRRAQLEQEEGLMSSQVDVLFNQAQERSEEEA